MGPAGSSTVSKVVAFLTRPLASRIFRPRTEKTHTVHRAPHGIVPTRACCQFGPCAALQVHDPNIRGGSLYHCELVTVARQTDCVEDGGFGLKRLCVPVTGEPLN